MAYTNFSWIVPGLAQGAYPGKHPGPPTEGFHVADVIVFCAEEKQPPKGYRAPTGKLVVRVPFDDDIYRPVPPEVGQIFHEVAAGTAKYLKSGAKVLSTCAMGLNRSGVITALTLMHAYGMQPNDVIRLIRGRRHKDALMNPMFEQFIRHQRVRSR